jgi:hypothetical protein
MVPVWTGVLALLGALVIGAGATLCLFGGGSDSGADQSPVRSGVVGRLFLDDPRTVCIGETSDADTVECYQVPGAGLKIGDRIRYRIEWEPIDPDNLYKGKEPVLVYVEGGEN